MLCPLLTVSERNWNTRVNEKIMECLTDECAWWDTKHGGCYMATIGRQLMNIEFGILAISGELTQLGPTSKCRG